MRIKGKLFCSEFTKSYLLFQQMTSNNIIHIFKSMSHQYRLRFSLIYNCICSDFHIDKIFIQFTVSFGVIIPNLLHTDTHNYIV